MENGIVGFGRYREDDFESVCRRDLPYITWLSSERRKQTRVLSRLRSVDFDKTPENDKAIRRIEKFLSVSQPLMDYAVRRNTSSNYVKPGQ